MANKNPFATWGHEEQKYVLKSEFTGKTFENGEDLSNPELFVQSNDRPNDAFITKRTFYGKDIVFTQPTTAVSEDEEDAAVTENTQTVTPNEQENPETI